MLNIRKVVHALFADKATTATTAGNGMPTSVSFTGSAYIGIVVFGEGVCVEISTAATVASGITAKVFDDSGKWNTITFSLFRNVKGQQRLVFAKNASNMTAYSSYLIHITAGTLS